MNLVRKLLKKNVSKSQLIGFSIANMLGLAIVLLALQFFFDINPLFSEKDTLFKRDFFVVTKKVKTLNAFNQNAATFSVKEIEELKNARFVKTVGAFTASQFEVYGGITGERSGLNFSTELFFESVPNDFIDVKSTEWAFSSDKNFIPIIIPKTYLDLYNFGFAQARSMPKISESLIGLISMQVIIAGNGKQHTFEGKIVGFSNRINTILVPDDFMQWANNEFSDEGKQNPARIILEVDNIADSQIATFFKARGYEIEGENQAVGRMSFFLRVIVGIVVFVGTFICLLSFIILILSIFLLLQKDMQKLQNLRLIGYSKNAVTQWYILLATCINFVAVVLAITVVLVLRVQYLKMLSSVWTSFEPASVLPTVLIGFGIFATLSVVNVLIIRKKVD